MPRRSKPKLSDDAIRTTVDRITRRIQRHSSKFKLQSDPRLRAMLEMKLQGKTYKQVEDWTIANPEGEFTRVPMQTFQTVLKAVDYHDVEPRSLLAKAEEEHGFQYDHDAERETILRLVALSRTWNRLFREQERIASKPPAEGGKPGYIHSRLMSLAKTINETEFHLRRLQNNALLPEEQIRALQEAARFPEVNIAPDSVDTVRDLLISGKLNVSLADLPMKGSA